MTTRLMTLAALLTIAACEEAPDATSADEAVSERAPDYQSTFEIDEDESVRSYGSAHMAGHCLKVEGHAIDAAERDAVAGAEQSCLNVCAGGADAAWCDAPTDTSTFDTVLESMHQLDDGSCAVEVSVAYRCM